MKIIVLCSEANTHVFMMDSKILAETYQAMPAYRICTVDGVTQLTEGLAKKLKELLEQVMAEEQVLSC